MTYVVTGRCLKCKYTDCVEVCPVDTCFHDGPEMLYINPETCIDCNLCVSACPIEAIFHEDDVPERYKKFIKINEEEHSKYKMLSIHDKTDPLPGAKTLAEILKEEEQNQ